MTVTEEAGFRRDGSRAARWLVGTAAIAALAVAAPAYAAGTVAGTKIENTAQAVYELPDGEDSDPIESNTVTLTVAQVLDVAVVAGADVSVDSPDTDQVLTFTVTNSGNFAETFDLEAVVAAAGNDFDPTDLAIYIDANDNGEFDPGVDGDTLYTGANGPTLDADASIAVFVVSNIPDELADGDAGSVVLTATAASGTGAPGTVVGAGTGPEDADIVVGSSGGEADDTGTYVVDLTPPPPVPDLDLEKTILSVVDPISGDEAVVTGSIVTYQIVADVTGEGTLVNLRITDLIPEGTEYEAETITLDGAELTDADDTDAGEYTGTGISVSLGSVTAPATHTVTFQVEVADE